MKESYGVMEVKTGVVLVVGSYKYCKEWILKNCKYNEKYDTYADADHKFVTITVL